VFSKQKREGQNSTIIPCGALVKGVLQQEYLEELCAYYKQSNLSLLSIAVRTLEQLILETRHRQTIMESSWESAF
jgi:hypothetical protein